MTASTHSTHRDAYTLSLSGSGLYFEQKMFKKHVIMMHSYVDKPHDYVGIEAVILYVWGHPVLQAST